MDILRANASLSPDHGAGLIIESEARHAELCSTLTKAYQDRFNCRDTLTVSDLTINPLCLTPKSGYIVALRYSESVQETVARFAAAASEIVPGIVQKSKAVHTSLFVIGAASKDDFIADSAITTRMFDAVRTSVPRLNEPVPVIQFSRWGFNRDTVILPGIPKDSTYIKLLDRLLGPLQDHFPVAAPSLLHTTALRFGRLANPGEAEALFELCRSTPHPDEGQIVSIDIGVYSCGPTEFDMTTHARIVL